MKRETLVRIAPNSKPVTIRVQSILYNTNLASVERSLEYLDNAARNAIAGGDVASVAAAYGDCSARPVFDEETLERLRRSFPNLARIDRTFFGENLGSAGGHNRLLAESEPGADAGSDFTVIINPDVLAFPNLFGELLTGFTQPRVGLAEARQIPIEHPKDYDPLTGETSWASTACAMAPTRIFRQLHGFDSDSFFLYCDDVDFSWRVRLAGYSVVHRSSATVFHDKRLTAAGGWDASDAEKYYSAEAALLLTYKYSRADLTEQYLDSFRNSGSAPHVKAAAAIELRKTLGRMPTPIDESHSVGQFIDGNYAVHRFAAT